MLALKASSTCVRTQICRMASNPKWPIYSDQIVQSIQFEYCITALFWLTPKMAYVTITQIYCIFSVGSFLFSVLDCALMMAVLQFSRGQLSLADLVRSSDSHGRSGARSGGILSVRPAPPRPRPADDRSDCRQCSNLHTPFSTKCEESSHLQAKKWHFCPTNCEDSHVFIWRYVKIRTLPHSICK